MMVAPHHSELSEVLVQGDQYTFLFERQTKDLRISRIGGPLATPHDVVATVAKVFDCATAHASIEEEFQAVLSKMAGSTRSCPTARLAKTRQARMSSRSSQG